ncbi:MAG TPA: chlorite dismutase family protein [Anaerolineaceae bacterium]|nr:chlorite dismutase family protein [Anaerolineaceae bacterium]
MSGKTINHFLFFKLADPFWTEKRSTFFKSFAAELQATGACTSLYQVSPLSAENDFLIWNAAPLESEQDEATFFERIARAVNLRRGLVQPAASLWGYTKPSVYARGPSAQEIDPFAARRQTYLVLYPFVKTIQWYLLGKDTRQGMMNEHIRIGHQYPEIRQLLLYSFGLQDQEFVVVYEMADLYHFSELVNELRGSDVREYTERDTPVYTGIWRSPEAMDELFSPGAGAQ